MSTLITGDMVAEGRRGEFPRRPSPFWPVAVLEGLTDVLTTTGRRRVRAHRRLRSVLRRGAGG